MESKEAIEVVRKNFPDNLSRIWTIDKINGEVITISDDYCEAEVYANE